MPPPRQLQSLLSSADFLLKCATVVSLTLVASVAIVLAALVCLLVQDKALPLAVVACLAAAAAYTVLDNRSVAATALADVARLLSGERREPRPGRAAAQGGPAPEAPPPDLAPQRSRRDMVRGLLDKVIDTAFESVAMYVCGLPALAICFAWAAHRSHHDEIAFLCGMVAVLLALFGFVPYIALRYIVTRQLDSIMDAIPRSAPAAAVHAPAAGEASPLLK